MNIVVKIILIILLVIAVLSVIIGYACCRAAARASYLEEQEWEDNNGT